MEMAMHKTPATHKNSAQAEPWKRKNPHGSGKHKQLSAEAKKAAKRRAEAAGRAYPNLVDNMWAARQDKK
jgi:hypothetical protein